MLLVRMKIKESGIHGIGLFADEFIPKGAVVWRFTPGFDLRFSPEELASLPPLLASYVCEYGWKSKKSGLYCLPSDAAKHCNHASSLNTLSEYRDDEEEVVTIAIADIMPGEEMTDDYNAFETEEDVDPRFKSDAAFASS